MVPRLFIPSEWLAALQVLPRPVAWGVLATALAMLVAGARFHRLLITALVALGGAAAGRALAGLMRVDAWYVVVPATLVAAAIVWPVARRLVPLGVAVLGACALGAFVAYGLRLANFWLGFGVGFAGGLLLGWLAFRFAAVLFFGALGTLGILGALAPAIDASEGVLARGAYETHALAYVVAGVVLFLASLVAQVSLGDERLT